MSALWHWQQAADLLNSSSHRYPCSVQYHYPDRLRRICRAQPLNQECITYRFQATPILCSSNWTPDGRYLALTAKCMHAWPEHTLHNAKDVAEHKVYEHILQLTLTQTNAILHYTESNLCSIFVHFQASPIIITLQFVLTTTATRKQLML